MLLRSVILLCYLRTYLFLFSKCISGVLSSADFVTALGFQNGDEEGSSKNSPSFQIYVAEDTTIIPKLHYGLRPEVKTKQNNKKKKNSFYHVVDII